MRWIFYVHSVVGATFVVGLLGEEEQLSCCGMHSSRFRSCILLAAPRELTYVRLVHFPYLLVKLRWWPCITELTVGPAAEGWSTIMLKLNTSRPQDYTQSNKHQVRF